MKVDILIIRIAFTLLLTLGGFFLNPLARSSHLTALMGENVLARQVVSALLGAVIALLIIGVEIRARRASLKTLIGAAVGSILGIVGAYLIGMLISTQDINTVRFDGRGGEG